MRAHTHTHTWLYLLIVTHQAERTVSSFHNELIFVSTSRIADSEDRREGHTVLPPQRIQGSQPSLLPLHDDVSIIIPHS